MGTDNDRDVQFVPIGSSTEYTDSNRGVALGGNKPLKKSPIRWTNDGPINEAQLKGMREEFWETAPKFEGRKEIWEALRGAAEAFESKDYDLAQAILTGVEISIPNGTLTQCYDTLGNHYAIPKYCLSAPTNIIQAEKTVDESLESPDAGGDGEESQSLINAVEIKLRLSTMKDVKVQISAKSAVRDLKKKLYQQEGIEPQKVRLLFSGRVLKDDDCIEDLKIPKGFIIQALVSS